MCVAQRCEISEMTASIIVRTRPKVGPVHIGRYVTFFALIIRSNWSYQPSPQTRGLVPMADLTATLNQISGALSAIANTIIGSVSNDASFIDNWGWQQPSTTKTDLSDRINKTILALQKLEGKDFKDPAKIARIQQLPQTISSFQSQTLPNLFGGNGYYSYVSLVSLLESIEGLIEEDLPKPPTWEEIDSNKLLPAPIKKRIDNVDRGLKNVEKQYGSILDKVSIILEGYEAASNLPATLAGIESAQEQYENAKKQIDEIAKTVGKHVAEIEKHKELIERYRVQSFEIAGEIEEVYSAATRQGLGKAFQDRANELKLTTFIMMAILFATLSAGVYISHDRIEFVEDLLVKPNLSMQILWANISLTAISVAGPIWFAWLLTRQIGQRFRLAEDYGFKASVAKAYEGYRREVQESGDKELQSRLLQIALDKVEEAPLSHIEHDEPASPFQEVLLAWAGKRKAGSAE